MQLLTEITSQIEWIKINKSTQDIAALQERTLELATNSFYLAALVADWYEKSNNAEYGYKRAVESYMATSTEAVSRAEYKAKAEYSDLNKEYRDTENTYKRLQLALAQCNVVIEQGRQAISFLKQEKRHEVN